MTDKAPMLVLLKSLLRSHAKETVCILALQIAQALLSLYLPTINASIIDVGVLNADTGYIYQRFEIMIVLSVLQFVSLVAASILGTKVALSVGRELRGRVFAHIMSFSHREMTVFGAPTLISRSTGDVQQIVEFLTFLFTVIINAPIMFVGGVLMACLQDIRLSFVILAVLPMLIGISVIFIARLVPLYREQQEGADDVNGALRDQISGVRVVKAFVKEGHEQRQFAGINQRLLDLSVHIGRLTTLLAPLFMFIVNATTVAILWFGGFLAETYGLPIGKIIAFITYMSFILTAVLLASLVFIMLPQADVSAERFAEVMRVESHVRQPRKSVHLASGQGMGMVEFDHVSFSYAPDDPSVAPVLKDISFTVRPGSTTAIIGSTGCGKSTLVSLIPRLTDPTAGTIRLGGHDIKELDAADIHRACGFVPQKAFLFSGSLRSNLLYANPMASEQDMWKALRIADAERFIAEDKAGLDIRVAQGGSNFSGGQRQRLAIARAIVHDPAIYVFDDSFSALDYATDRRVREGLSEVADEAAVIIVAQRVASIMHADQIIVMDKGEVADMGTHEQLLKHCDVYQQIVASQPREEFRHRASPSSSSIPVAKQGA
ncbi:MAG: ABC transporter ATP-binding protein [Bifidobacterium sp.]|uniref:ABC transporter ATP-binding protein n=1 Tax=Bifidobacterium sp. TaxID=41200 RepID=UPI0039E80A36